MKKPIIDIHCDLLIYLTNHFSDLNNKEDIGCSLPYLKEGNVDLQVMAIFTPTEENSHKLGVQQSEIFRNLNTQENKLYRFEKQHLSTLGNGKGVGMLAAVENASGFCDENMSLKEGFKNLETIIDNVGELFYISFTHHLENRFGGGNYSTAGLKNDGKALIDYLDNKNIAIDFSHTSDALAYEILNYVSKNNIKVPIIASHSNYRSIFDHPRNLPNEIAQEIIQREGLIGVNFLRAFVNNEKPEVLQEHIAHGLELGAQKAVCYGADFFYVKGNPDKSRIPYYYKEHENAGCYPQINKTIKQQFGEEVCNNISHQNVTDFLTRIWS
ncbi:MAG: membrane dipeptidase [Flavobacteriales bacterium]|nr:membrane dipeptidase [Flavobacteriales bacterium]MDG1176600.1 membrane dipeptidase [Flavobacteriales bacterium]